MNWNYDRSAGRIRSHLEGMERIEISKLVREADLESLLSETCCRDIYGAHVYVQVSNFPFRASEEYESDDSYRRLIQGLHIYQREVSRIVERTDLFGGLRVHFQGSKLHALFYRPISDSEKLATRALLLELVLKDFVRSVFNPAFPNLGNFSIAGGADLGNAIGTRNGMRGDRELLFLGAPANHAAKIIGSSGQLRLTGDVYDALPENLQEICEGVDDNLFQARSITQGELDGLLEEYKINWDRQASSARIEDDRDQFPLKDILYSSADSLIDMDNLSVFNNKRVMAASLFGDVTGFTRYIDAAETEGQQREALRVFHAIRKEMAWVVRDDFGGVRVQFQGDRIQGLFHLPKDNEEAIARKAVDAAVGLQSSMELTLKRCLPEAESLHLSAGVDIGTTLLSRLGTRGYRDRICLGEAVEAAAGCEERCGCMQIGITQRVLLDLPDVIRAFFSYDKNARCYVASDLTADKIERALKTAELYRVGSPVFVQSGAAGAAITSRETPGATRIIPAKPYAP